MTHVKHDNDLAHRVAEEFSRIIRDWFTAEQMGAMLQGNAVCGPHRCPTCPLCGTSTAMIAAFVLVTHRAPRLSEADDELLWSEARTIARQTHFARTMDLIENAEGNRVYAYLIKGTWIEDPRLSECSRFIVDPVTHYGLRPDEVLALERANAQPAPPLERSSDATHGKRQYPLPTIEWLCERFPGLKPSGTGGNCTALRLDCEDGSYILVTDRDEPRVPRDDATSAHIARYAANIDEIESSESLSAKELAGWIDAVLARIHRLTNVGDYFVRHLGAGPDDDSLFDLPLLSPCGESCAAAIDSAAAFIKHVRAAAGQDADHEARAVVRAVRNVIGIYWKG
jgi:hypothetical protein